MLLAQNGRHFSDSIIKSNLIHNIGIRVFRFYWTVLVGDPMIRQPSYFAEPHDISLIKNSFCYIKCSVLQYSIYSVLSVTWNNLPYG